MSREIELTVLVDNQALDGLKVEHGFSAWISVGTTHILYDTGAGSALRPNAASLGVDISRTGMLVLSHGHYDHTGGVTDVLTPAARSSCTPPVESQSPGIAAILTCLCVQSG